MTPAKKSGPPPGKKRGTPQRGGKPQRGSSGNTKPSQPTAAPPMNEKNTIMITEAGSGHCSGLFIT